MMTNEQSVTPRTGWGCLFWFPIVFACSYALQALWPLACPHPGVWDDLVIGLGLQPPGDPFPGLYRLIVALLGRFVEPAALLPLLQQIGRGLVSASAVCIYAVFSEALPGALRVQEHTWRLGQRIGRIVALIAAFLFTCAEPVWRAGWTFSPTTLVLFLCSLAAVLFFRFAWHGSVTALYGAAALLGLISTETTLGFLLTILALVGVFAAVRWGANPRHRVNNPLLDELVRLVVVKRLSYVWTGAFAVGITVNVLQFLIAGGLDATGHEGVLGLLFEYFRGAWLCTRDAATGPGWLFGFLFGIAPFIFILNMLSRAWDDDRFLPWSVGAVALAVGLASFTQLAGARVLWFWTWTGRQHEMVPCDILLAFFLVFNVATVAFVLTICGVDAYCRNYRRIAQQQFPESMLASGPAQMAVSLGKARVWRKRIFLALVILVPCLVLWGRIQPCTRGIGMLIADTAHETLQEMRGRNLIFTDGSFDNLLELMARAEGRTVLPLPLFAPSTVRARMLRDRAARGEEDRALFLNDAATALRDWIENDSPRLTNVAVQIGFEMWGKDKRANPTYSGLVALPGTVDAAELKRALAVSDDLGKRTEALARRGRADEEDTPEVAKIADVALRNKFPYVPWRLARLAQMRCRMAEKAGNRKLAMEEAEKADALDEANPSVQEIRKRTNWLKSHSGGQLTPREGLALGLRRADFTFAARYAAQILDAEPDDPRANFAMGMKFCQDEKFTQAERFLKRCLAQRPNEVAVLNNLAIAEMHLNKFSAALDHIDTALRQRPDVAELQQTRASVIKARDEAIRRTIKKAED